MQTESTRLRGLTLATVWQALAEPWRGLGERVPIRWMTPDCRVHLVGADGIASLWEGDRRLDGQTGDPSRARFVAVEIPQDEFLECRLDLPSLAPADWRDAVGLEVATASPFEPDDLVWGCARRTAGAGPAAAVAVIASRRAVEARLAAVAGNAGRRQAPEVWAIDSTGRPVVVEGYGEAARRRSESRGRALRYLLAMLALMLGAANAVTPTVQLALRTLQAGQATQELEQRAAPALASREALIKAEALLAALRERIDERVDPLLVMDLLTQIIPDDTWLQRLQVQGTKITLSGQTPNVSALMNTLSGHERVSDVKSPQASTRAMSAGRENFTIELTLAPDALRAMPPLPARASDPAAPARSGS